MQQFTPIPRILIEQELDRVLSSKGFVNSPILCRFLRYIVCKTLDGSQREINYYFHGSISVEADTVHVGIRLYESADDMLIWSDTYHFNTTACAPDLELEKISSRVASTICGYSGLLFARHREQSIEAGYGSIQEEALHLYYGNQIHNNAETFHRALQRIEWFVKTYGDCSWCYAILASMYADGVVYGYLQDADSIEHSTAYTARALELDPDHQHALFAQAWLIVMIGNREAALVAIDRMRRVNPHVAFFNMTIAIGLSFIGEYDKSTKLVKDLLEVIPVPSWWIHVPHTISSIKKRYFRAALFHAKKIGRLNTIFDSVFEIIAVYHLGDFHELRELVSKYHNRFPTGLKYLQRAFTLIFHDDDLKMLMNETIAGILTRLDIKNLRYKMSPPVRPGANQFYFFFEPIHIICV